MKTRRTNGRSIQATIRDINLTLRGGFEYFKHITKRYVFVDLDCFIRQRPRAILKKHNKRPGIPKGRDFHRWPNAYFGNLELFSLTAAHVYARQPSTR